MKEKIETRGRKGKEEGEKIVPVTTYVKAKHKSEAKEAIDKTAKKFR